MLDPRYVNARRRLLRSAAEELFGALAAADVPSMLLKGEATAQTLYPAAEVRYLGDVDVLVRRADLQRTQRALETLGYTPAFAQARAHEVARHASNWRRGTGQQVVDIDLHTSFHGVTAAPEELWDCWWEGARRLELGTQAVCAPSLATTALIVAVHRQRSRAGSAAARDLELAMAQFDVGIWRAAAAQAYRLGCDATMTAGLLHHPEGAALVHRLGLNPTLTRREELYREREHAFAIGWYEWWHTPGVGRRVRRLGEELWPSPDILRLNYPMAGRGPRWVAIAHAQRVLDLLRRSPSGMIRAFRPKRRTRMGR